MDSPLFVLQKKFQPGFHPKISPLFDSKSYNKSIFLLPIKNLSLQNESFKDQQIIKLVFSSKICEYDDENLFKPSLIGIIFLSFDTEDEENEHSY
jgi:hypothetical protein